VKIGVARRHDGQRLCAIVDGYAVDLQRLAGRDGPRFLDDLGNFLRAEEAGRDAVRAMLNDVDAAAAGGTPVEETLFAAPYVPGAKIVCHAVNYPAHAGDVGIGASPYFFYKPPTSVIGPGDDIDPHSSMSDQLDFETELAVVIGTKARDVPVECAYEVVAGYTIVNDVSHRSFQFSKHVPDLRARYGMNWTQGKGLDASCVIGPWITLTDELAEPYPLQLRTWVDGELRQDASTNLMIFKVPQLIAEITRGMTFQPGDVIATGTPSGTILDSGGAWLRHGNTVRCEIEALGAFENTVGEG
jgi:2-keto-4-pentenoate hydratase/2-oxohepta-3-ene-1,7-dioic acid hydratase in catechol pathway